MEVFQAHAEPNVYLVLSEWESHEAMRSFLMEERHGEIIRAYKRGYGVGFERRPRVYRVVVSSLRRPWFADVRSETSTVTF